MSETKVNSFWLSKLKSTVVNKGNPKSTVINKSKLNGTVVNKGADEAANITGRTLEDFHIDRKMDILSGEADIYLCTGLGSRAGKQYVLKYYRRKNAVKSDVVKKLMGIKSPCVASIESFGIFEKRQYTVLPYYAMPTLSEILADGTRFSEDELRTRIIPSVIEGLRAVHKAGVLHKDLKPGNLIPDATGKHIVLIDFGISSDAGDNTFVMTKTGMTPFYAAPEAMQGIFHRETDYYALGITIFELFTGFTPFQNPGLTGEDVARLASVSKIEFPDNFPKRLKKLVLGLTYKDISHRNEKDNPNKRWGYDEVKRWLRGEDVPVPGTTVSPCKTPSAAATAFPPYRFNGTTCRNEDELIKALLANPKLGIRDLGRGLLTHHYLAINEKKGEICEKAEKLIEHSNDKVRDFVDFLFKLAPNSDGFGAAVFGKREYEFKNAKAFLGYIDGLAKAGNYYEIWYLFRNYGNTLKIISAKAWPSDTYRRLKEMAAPIILFGDRIFRDDKAFAEYLNCKISANENTPLNLKNFVAEHERVLLNLQERPALANVISRLMKFGKFREPENTVITVNGIQYSAATSIKKVSLGLAGSANSVKKGSIIKFGSYPQNTEGKKAPIEWLVLDVSGNEALLISRYGLFYYRYHEKVSVIDMTWEECMLRTSLNYHFLKEAFSKDEIKRIKVSELRNDEYLTRGGNSTKDRVFCLSLVEAEQYFKDDSARKCRPTEYAKNQKPYFSDMNGYCWWWLRSPGNFQSWASCVSIDGSLDPRGTPINTDQVVRPALRIICNL